MAVDLILQDSSNYEVSVPLNGAIYTVNYNYNSRDSNWRISVFYQGVLIFYPETVKPEAVLFESQDEDILGGTFYCHRLVEGSEITRDNFFSDFVIRFYLNSDITDIAELEE